MSKETGVTAPETGLPNGDADAANTPVQTVEKTEAGKAQTGVSQEEFQKAQSQLAAFKKELASRDAKITELQKATEAKKDETVTLKSLQEQLQQERTARVRTEFALKNGVTDDLLGYLQGSTPEELSGNWTTLSGLIDAKAEEKRKGELSKLGDGVTNASNTSKADSQRVEIEKDIEELFKKN